MTGASFGPFLERCVLLDLETTVQQAKIRRVGAIHRGRTLARQAPFSLREVLAELDALARDAELVVGHNIADHDLAVLEAAAPKLRLLRLPAVDTLLLSPLAFPKNPYHQLLKPYKPEELKRQAENDPVADAQLAAKALDEEWTQLTHRLELGDRAPHLFRTAWELRPDRTRGTAVALAALGARVLDRPTLAEVFAEIAAPEACTTAVRALSAEITSGALEDLVPLAYLTAWLPVSGAKSIVPHWVRRRFPEVDLLVKRLRDTACTARDCPYCQEQHAPELQLKRYFGLPSFQPKPATPTGGSLQEAIVRAGMNDTSLLALVPTGGGKSIGYQLPGLVRSQRRGALTIVISPLQALMKDQVDGLNRRTGSTMAATLNGMLTMPERSEVLLRVRMGDVGLLYVSPEQLRNNAFRKAVMQREIGAWVFDEAHCLSQWGHDFRPDYLYAARFIRELAQRQGARSVPPIGAFTATAKREVKEEILAHLREHLGVELAVFEAPVTRDNLTFEVRETELGRKSADVAALVRAQLAAPNAGSVIVYLATQRGTMEMADYLRREDLPAEHFHGGMEAPLKKRVQADFLAGDIPVICATNAFGMGIDKEDVRLVVHADIPGSLEAYLQEAGRAGRDRQEARCVLLYTDADVETQFGLERRSELGRRDIQTILREIQKLRRRGPERVVVTVTELLRGDPDGLSFDVDDRQADTKVKNAIGWLEGAELLQRDENHTRVFQGRPRVRSVEEGAARMDRLRPPLHPVVRRQWMALLEALMSADPDELLSADDLALAPEVLKTLPAEPTSDGRTASELVLESLLAMTRAGLLEDGLLCTAFVRWKVDDSSDARLQAVCALDRAMLDTLRELDPDADRGEWVNLRLRDLNQRLLDQGLASAPERLKNLLSSLEWDGRGQAGDRRSIELRWRAKDVFAVRLQRTFTELADTAEKRRAVASVVLRAILARVPKRQGASADVLVEFALADLSRALEEDLELRGRLGTAAGAGEHGWMSLLQRALTFLHEQEVIILQQGLAVFRQAMTLTVPEHQARRRWTRQHHERVEHHYRARVFQIHVMAEYARLGLDDMSSATGLVSDYFARERSNLVETYFADRKDILAAATTAESYRRIVEDLRDVEQQLVVASEPGQNLLVLAGPGSGKTTVVVHRVAWLVRVRRVKPAAILVLAFNRSAMLEIRRRLRALIGDDATWVEVQTYHALALRLAGRTLTTAPKDTATRDELRLPELEEIMEDAIALLGGQTSGPRASTPDAAAREYRERVLTGRSHILVDEYQDIDDRQYRFIAALAGLAIDDKDQKLSLLAVGDDDQNIYAFRDTNVAFIKRFEDEYEAKRHHLVRNYRSTKHVIAAANQLIAKNRDRMKTRHPIEIDARRRAEPAGGRWTKLDPVALGRVQVLEVADARAEAGAVRDELLRLRGLDPHLAWPSFAVLARHHADLARVRLALEEAEIPVRYTIRREEMPPIFRIREVARFLRAVRARGRDHVDAAELRAMLAADTPPGSTSPWRALLEEQLDAWAEDTGGTRQEAKLAAETIVEALIEQRRTHAIGHGVLLTTIHGAKGMEFPHVLVTDPGPAEGRTKGTDEEERRVLYVAMTRAKETLALVSRARGGSPLLDALEPPAVLRRPVEPEARAQGAGRFELLGLDDLYVDYASRRPPADPIHAALAALEPGAPLYPRTQGELVVFEDGRGVAVASLARAKVQAWRARLPAIARARVVAVTERSVEDLGEGWDALCKRWAVPVIEVLVTD